MPGSSGTNGAGSAGWSKGHGGNARCRPSEEQALRAQIEAAPTETGQSQSRWTLALLQKTVTGLGGYSLSGIWRLLKALRIHYKRGQQHVHSPDPSYAEKVAQITRCVQEAREQPDEVVTLFLDEFSFYRWALVAPVYAQAGRVQPKVDLPCRYNTAGRIVSVINAVTGQVLYRQRAHITVEVLAEMMHDIRKAYPNAKQIFVVQDNWHHVHFHAKQVAAAQQEGITLIAMPTYAAWLNPIEKLWRKLKQEVLHMHRSGDDWDELKKRVTDFLDQFASGSPELVRYVGLLPD